VSALSQQSAAQYDLNAATLPILSPAEEISMTLIPPTILVQMFPKSRSGRSWRKIIKTVGEDLFWRYGAALSHMPLPD
jgi:hypothetical protein